MSVVDDVRLDEYQEPGSPTRRRPAPKANPFFRFVFPVVILALGAWVFALWREGTKAVLDSTDGTVVAVVTDPTAPGYEVFVDPTPTLLIAHLDEGQLVGVTVLARTLLDNGGSAVLIGADLAPGGAGSPTLAERWRDGGMEALETDIGSLFGFGFLETDAIETPELAQLLSLVEPLPFNALDPLVEIGPDGTSVTFLRAGGAVLTGDEAAEVYRWRNPGEFEANRTERQLDLWQSWLLRVAAADIGGVAALPSETGVSPYLRAFADGKSELEILPAVPDPGVADTATYALDARGREWLDEMATRMVPLRISPLGSPLPTVRLLDGTGDTVVRDAVLDRLADVSEVLIVGNAASFDVAHTTVTYHAAEHRGAADAVARELGAEVVFSEQPDQPVDLTVEIGTDWEAS